MRKLYLFILLFLFASQEGFAQNLTQTLRGKVYDQSTLRPLQGATVLILHTKPVLGATTDEKGHFSIKNVPLGRSQPTQCVNKIRTGDSAGCRHERKAA